MNHRYEIHRFVWGTQLVCLRAQLWSEQWETLVSWWLTAWDATWRYLLRSSALTSSSGTVFPLWTTHTHTNRRLRTRVKPHKWNLKTSESAPSFSRWSGRWPCLGAAKKGDQLDHFWTCDLTHTIIPLMNTCVSRTFCMISGVIPTCSLTSMASPPAP